MAMTVNAVLGLHVPGVAVHLTIIESNSTDGTRDAVLAYARHPRVRVLLEEAPRGKGAAVRAALSATDGDIVLIQDADLEYDVSDYPLLLAPILDGEADFVLGTRHAGTRPMRQFDDQPMTAQLMNIGHSVFTGLFNRLFRVRLTDPFTMYKVFRRECLDGITLRCNRFDFDWELAARLIQHGFHPIEVPVKYESRSFNDGKKVRFFRDPITWVATSVRCKLTPPGRHPSTDQGSSRQPLR